MKNTPAKRWDRQSCLSTQAESLCHRDKKTILRARALELARAPEDKQAPAEFLEVVEFLLAGERYAVESRYVREVRPLDDLTPLPCTPQFVLGVVNVRGEILSVIDLKKFFDLPEKGLPERSKVILLRAEEMELGLLADEVFAVRPVPLESLQAPPPTLSGIRAEYLRGVTKERLAILDAEKLLLDKKIIVREEVEP